MNKQLLVTILLLFGNYYTKADVKELLSDSKILLSPFSHKQNHYHEELVLKDHGNVINGNYIHNKPKVIDDPLPVKVDFIKPIDIDFANDKPEPIFRGSALTGLLLNFYEKPLFRERPARELPTSHVIIEADNKQTNNKLFTVSAFKPADHKAESSIESITYTKNPTEVDVVPINFFVGPATTFKLFNHNDDDQLSGSAPEVIFKPGDDTAFLKDTSVIDDYEHNPPEEEEVASNTLSSKKVTTTKTFGKKIFDKSKHHDVANTAAASDHFYVKTSVESEPSAATQQLVTHEGKSEITHSGHGYIYDRPQIPFES